MLSKLPQAVLQTAKPALNIGEPTDAGHEVRVLTFAWPGPTCRFPFLLGGSHRVRHFSFRKDTMLDRIKKWLATSRTWDPSCDHLVNAQGRPACDMRGRINPDCRGCTEYHQNQLRYVDQVELLQRRADALGRIIVVLRGELAKLKARVPQYEQRIAENQEKKDGHEKTKFIFVWSFNGFISFSF